LANSLIRAMGSSSESSRCCIASIWVRGPRSRGLPISPPCMSPILSCRCCRRRRRSARSRSGKLEGKVALVTGSGRNIGRATVLKLAGEGAHVVVNARANRQEAESVACEARDLGIKAVPILADVGKKAEVESLAARALSEFGRVDILINNAAIRPHKPFTESTDADWELVRSVVLDGPLHLTRALIEPMVENRYGRILFFCGDGSISASGSGRTHLSAISIKLKPGSAQAKPSTVR